MAGTALALGVVARVAGRPAAASAALIAYPLIRSRRAGPRGARSPGDPAGRLGNNTSVSG
ncbi:hypothetical protein GCM10009681_00180 [Luedemannella helvata]|uniref:Uncharacterized protein n=1 Tax=Luedemannella helvata TaxID=349315 RepID=A0ABP4VPR1_9ACTN